MGNHASVQEKVFANTMMEVRCCSKALAPIVDQMREKLDNDVVCLLRIAKEKNGVVSVLLFNEDDIFGEGKEGLHTGAEEAQADLLASAATDPAPGPHPKPRPIMPK